jgi:hypothetical protein
MTGRFVGTVSAMLIVTATLMYNSHVSWKVYIENLRGQQSLLKCDGFNPTDPIVPLYAGDV